MWLCDGVSSRTLAEGRFIWEGPMHVPCMDFLSLLTSSNLVLGPPSCPRAQYLPGVRVCPWAGLNPMNEQSPNFFRVIRDNKKYKLYKKEMNTKRMDKAQWNPLQEKREVTKDPQGNKDKNPRKWGWTLILKVSRKKRNKVKLIWKRIQRRREKVTEQ